MLSSRPSYYPDPMNHHQNAGIEFYRRSDNGIRMPLGLNPPLLQDAFENGGGHGHMSRRTTPSSTDTDGRHTSGPPRKRVPVACERCRKRKIKCSGDEGGGCSNCRNAGLSGCNFHRVATIPDATSYMAYRQEMRTRAHTNHWNQSHHNHVHRYSPYSIPSPSLHYSRHPVSAYASYASTSPNSYGAHSGSIYGADYTTPYSTGVSQGVSWTRTGSYSAYHGYDSEVPASASSNAYGHQAQPASFLLPNTDPMSSTANTGYNTLLYPYARSNSQVWADHSLMNANYGGEASADNATASYENSMPTAATSHKADASVPYPLITNTSSLNVASGCSDRTLPTPGGRPYLHSHHPSAFDNLPLSAVSHRSSVGWSTDSGSGASQVSSQSSLTSSTSGSHEHLSERSTARRTAQESQDPEYGYVSYDNSPQTTLTNNVVGISDEMPLGYNTVSQMKQTSHFVNATDATNSPSLARDLPSRNQRCRTVSQDSTPIQQSTANSTIPGSTPTNTSNSSTLTVTNTVNNSNTSGSVAELGVTSSAPTYAANLYGQNHDNASNHSHQIYGGRAFSNALISSPFRLNPTDSLITPMHDESSSNASPKTLSTNNYRTYRGGSGGYTTTPHQASASSFPHTNLVVPSPHSQTRGASGNTTSGEGAARMTSVSSGGSASGSSLGYTSARGSNGSTTSMLSNFGGGADGVGYGTVIGGQYGHAGRSTSGAGLGLSIAGRAESSDHSTSAAAGYPDKDVGSSGILNHSSARLSARLCGEAA